MIMRSSLDWLIKWLRSRKKALASYTIVLCLVESKLIVPASSKRRVLHHQNDVVDKGCKRRDHEVIAMRVTVMCSNKKAYAYQTPTTHFPFDRFTA